jgi:hypothetical protein
VRAGLYVASLIAELLPFPTPCYYAHSQDGDRPHVEEMPTMRFGAGVIIGTIVGAIIVIWIIV